MGEQSFCPPTPQESLVRQTRRIQKNLSIEDDTKCDVGSERNPVMPTKLAPWHHVNKTNYVPPDDNIPVHGTHDVPTLYRFPMSVGE